MTALADSVQRLAAGTRAPAGDIDALHWQGGPIDCAACPCLSLRELPGQQGCEPGHACLEDVYARRIDRFFRWHPELGDAHLSHPYFEVRAIAARHGDPDYGVCELVAMRLPLALLVILARDPDRAVRMRVAQRLEMPALLRMADDREAEVRRIVAQRLPVSLLARLVRDEDWRVRWEVAQRGDASVLAALRDDEDSEVRLAVAERRARQINGLGVVHG
ncbi:MAG: 4Fe4S-binding leucine-rich repeat protein [Polaromonas sp.]|nr:4Fe4S-binding leucine-rich repeat protein [Polaromonas sp.]